MHAFTLPGGLTPTHKRVINNLTDSKQKYDKNKRPYNSLVYGKYKISGEHVENITDIDEYVKTDPCMLKKSIQYCCSRNNTTEIFGGYRWRSTRNLEDLPDKLEPHTSTAPMDRSYMFNNDGTYICKFTHQKALRAFFTDKLLKGYSKKEVEDALLHMRENAGGMFNYLDRNWIHIIGV